MIRAGGRDYFGRPATLLLFTLLTAGLQVQVVVPFSAAGLRMCPADLAAMALAAWLALELARPPRWVPWSSPVLPAAILAATLALAIGAAVGWRTMGHVSGWALTNKLAGWLVLLCYLAAGLGVATIWGARGRDRVVKMLVGAIAVACALNATGAFLLFWEWMLGLPMAWKSLPLQGFVGNRNAFTMLAIAGLALVVADGARTTRLFSDAHVRALVAFLVLCVIYSASRSGIASAAFVVALALWRGGLAKRSAAAAAGIGVVLFAAISAARYAIVTIVGTPATETGPAASVIPPLWISHNDPVAHAGTEIGFSDFQRLTSYSDALDLWLESPWLGAGLGTFIEKHVAATGHPLIIHNTALWLLTELGVVGLLAFGFLAFAVVAGLARPDRRQDNGLSLAALLLCAGFALMSLVHEVMYQRVLWLVLGLALAVPRKTDDGPCAA